MPDPMGAGWANDDRKDRIARVLSERDNFLREDMERLQLDTVGRFRQQLLTWVADHATSPSGPRGALIGEWRAWNGDSRSEPRIFTHSTIVEQRLLAVLLGRVAGDLLGADKNATYAWYMKRAWLLTVLNAPGSDGLTPFGLTASEVADHLLDHALAQDPKLVLHQESNRFGGKHPFVGRVPVFGRFFAVDAPVQWGAPDLVLAERGDFGPSMRLVWDLKEPLKSTWSFPVGQSGHAGSKHYKDFQAPWAKGAVFPVFNEGDTGWTAP